MIRRIRKEEKALLRRLWDEEFAFDDDGFTSFFFDHYYDLCTHYVLEEDDIKTVASLCYHDVCYQGSYVKAAMILGVITLKEYRHKGYMDILLKHLLTEVLKDDPFVMIQAYDQELYRHLGFKCEYNRFRYYADTPVKGRYSELNNEELLNIYDTYCSEKEGFYRRTADDMELRKKAVEAMRGLYLGNKGAYCEFYPEKAFVECLVYNNKEDARKLLEALVYDYGNIEVCDDDDLYGRGEAIPYTLIKMNEDKSFVLNKKAFMHEYL